METKCIFLNDLHGFQLFQFRFFREFIIPFIPVSFQVSCIRYITDITYFEAQVKEVAVNKVEGNKGPAIAQVNIAVYGWSAYIQANSSGMDGFEFLFGT